MNSNQMQCLPPGGQPVAVAKQQAVNPLPAPTPIISFGKMRLVCALGKPGSTLAGRISETAPPQSKCAA